MNKKKCTKCKKFKLLKEFNKQIGGFHKQGYRSHCKECVQEYKKKYNKDPKNKKQVKEYRKKYNKDSKNKKRIKEYRKKYSQKMKKYLKEYSQRPEVKSKRKEYDKKCRKWRKDYNRRYYKIHKQNLKKINE